MTNHGHPLHKSAQRSSEPARNTGETGEAPLSLQSTDSMSPQTILRLQRIIGNQAVQRVIGGAPVRPTGVTPAIPDQAAILVAAQFQKKVFDQAQEPVAVGSRVGRGSAVPQAPAAPKAPDAPKSPASLALKDKRKSSLADIMTAYRAYDADKSISNLIKVHDFIHHWLLALWKAQSTRDIGLHTEGVKQVMEETTAAIRERVSEEMGKNGTDANENTQAVLNPKDKEGKPAKIIQFFEDVGVPINFYSQLPEKHVELFKMLYDSLNLNKPDQVTALIKALQAQNIVGFPLIKGLFLTHFDKVAGIDHLRSTQYKATSETKEAAFHQPLLNPLTPEQLEQEAYSKSSGESQRNKVKQHRDGLKLTKTLTNAEFQALSLYATDGYVRFNAHLRDNDLSKPAEKEHLRQHTQRANQIAVLTSALNKLPQYSGIAYRMLNAFGDFDATVKPGGVFTDLAFVSASMTAQGAEYGGVSGGSLKPGALETYVMIHTKAAANMTILGISRETEVLFRPGTRFYVNAIWRHIKGQVPKAAPPEAQMILLRNGEKKTVYKPKLDTTFTGQVRVVEMTEM